MNVCPNEPTICEVEKWVKDLFQDAYIDIPDLKTNNECRKLLLNIISRNKEAEKDVEETIKAESYLADNYVQKSNEISCSFADEFSMNDLHPDVAERVKKIAHVAVQMKLKEPTVTNFLLSSCLMDNKRESLMEQELVDSFAMSKFSQKISDIIHKNVILERSIEILERKVSKQQTVGSSVCKQSDFFKIKSEEYSRKIKKAEKQLKNLGWNYSLSHNELVKRHETIQCLKQKVNDLTLKLESYQNLPANEMLTKFKIEEAQAELLRLQNEFDSLLKVIS